MKVPVEHPAKDIVRPPERPDSYRQGHLPFPIREIERQTSISTVWALYGQVAVPTRCRMRAHFPGVISHIAVWGELGQQYSLGQADALEQLLEKWIAAQWIVNRINL
jgi:hypothetical protein